MPFDIIVKGVGEKKLGDLIALIGTKDYAIQVSYLPHPNRVAANAEKKASPTTVRVGPDEALTMTGKDPRPRPDTFGDKMLKLFERLEKKHGIGNISRGYLQDSAKFCKNPSQVVTVLLADGHMASLEPGGVDAATIGR